MKVKQMIFRSTELGFFIFFIYLLVFPDSATEPTRNALVFCAQTLVPSLFIYMVLSKIIMCQPLTAKIMKIFSPWAVALVMGILCGAPIGAKNAVSLYDSGKISKKYGEYLCSFTNNPSLSFVIGFAGKELLGDSRLGIKLLIFEITSCLITAFVMKLLIFGKEKLPKPDFENNKKIGIWEAVSESALTMVNLCACVVFFMILGNTVSKALNLSPLAEGILKSALEFSSGCAAAAKTGKFAFPLIAFALGQTGASVALQVKSVIGNRFSVVPFAIGKLVTASVMTFLAVVFG